MSKRGLRPTPAEWAERTMAPLLCRLLGHQRPYVRKYDGGQLPLLCRRCRRTVGWATSPHMERCSRPFTRGVWRFGRDLPQAHHGRHWSTEEATLADPADPTPQTDEAAEHAAQDAWRTPRSGNNPANGSGDGHHMHRPGSQNPRKR